MKYIISILLIALTFITVIAKPPTFAPEPVILDLSKSHSVDTFINSGVIYKDISDSSLQSYSYSYQTLIIKLPRGRAFEQNVELGIADARNGELINFTTAGVIMTHDDAYEVARKIHRNLGLPEDQLDQWYQSEKDEGRNAEGYSISTGENMYPRVAVIIRDSINGKYPWVIALKVNWNWKKHSDWDEARANRENRPPPEQYASLSLEPPGGDVYDRSDAYPDAVAYSEQVKSEQENQSTQAKSDPATISTETEEKSQSFTWLLIAGAFALLIIVFLRFQRRRG